jgi:hypothetical protein
MWAIVNVLVCLSNTVRSQSFSLSQRFNPAYTVQLCFTLLPSIGFQPSELFPLGQPYSLSGIVTLMSFKLTRVSNTVNRFMTFVPASDCLDKHGNFRQAKSFRLQSLTPAEYPSCKHCVLPQRSTRCSRGLYPLRGPLAHSLGLRPPLMYLCVTPNSEEFRCSAMYFRVSIRLNQERTPKSPFNLLEVSHLIRTPKPKFGSCQLRTPFTEAK